MNSYCNSEKTNFSRCFCSGMSPYVGKSRTTDFTELEYKAIDSALSIRCAFYFEYYDIAPLILK